ncbi:LysR family transcriptional regulator [Psychromonas sp. psych-6C06]|uniref:LysR family transcriptional regulator n=1 Tax=Psychromonas sp. psych-6C06 TaxID=2058089 RepID=UPI000C3311FA|nr:LysR family transcriptional regulator [Psychromonas sp. psych-6C06]PKF61966.1 LysR family transcriptional regulator [Psychromonas sp. psych-6C06]
MRNNLDIQSIDVLVKMYELSNVKLVANSLDKSSSAISKILSKLKIHFEDPLFVQTKSGFEPTPFMEDNIGYFEHILSNLDAIQHTSFNPQTLKQDIIIYGAPLFLDRFADKLYLEIRKQAPVAKIFIRQWNLEARSRLIAGEDAVLFNAYDETLPQVMMQKTICDISPTFFVRNNHPAHTFQELQAFPLVITGNASQDHFRYPLLQRLNAIGNKVICHGEIENTLAIENLVRSSDIYSVTMGQQFPEGCRAIELPSLSDFNLNLAMIYHRVKQNDPQKKWLFKLSEKIINHQ